MREDKLNPLTPVQLGLAERVTRRDAAVAEEYRPEAYAEAEKGVPRGKAVSVMRTSGVGSRCSEPKKWARRRLSPSATRRGLRFRRAPDLE